MAIAVLRFGIEGARPLIGSGRFDAAADADAL